MMTWILISSELGYYSKWCVANKHAPCCNSHLLSSFSCTVDPLGQSMVNRGVRPCSNHKAVVHAQHAEIKNEMRSDQQMPRTAACSEQQPMSRIC